MNKKTPHHDLNLSIKALLETTQHIDKALFEMLENHPGFKTGQSDGATPTLNDGGTPAGLERYLRPDIARDHYRRTLNIILQIKTISLELHSITTIWANETLDGQPKQSAADCVACARIVNAPDRIRAGFCGSCYRAWNRSCINQTRTLDRFQWIIERRAHLRGDKATQNNLDKQR